MARSKIVNADKLMKPKYALEIQNILMDIDILPVTLADGKQVREHGEPLVTALRKVQEMKDSGEVKKLVAVACVAFLCAYFTEFPVDN